MKAINSNMLENSITDSTDAIVNITGGSDISLKEANFIMTKIKEETNENINIIFGIRKDESIRNEIHVSIIATSGKVDSKPIEPKSEKSLNIFGRSTKHKKHEEEEFDQEFVPKNVNVQDDSFKIIDDEDDEIPFFLK
jgi:cell division protein FtsZ